MKRRTNGSILVDVKLHKLDLSRQSSVDNLVEGAGSEGGDHLDDSSLVGVEEALSATDDRRQDHFD